MFDDKRRLGVQDIPLPSLTLNQRRRTLCPGFAKYPLQTPKEEGVISRGTQNGTRELRSLSKNDEEETAKYPMRRARSSVLSLNLEGVLPNKHQHQQ